MSLEKAFNSFVKYTPKEGVVKIINIKLARDYFVTTMVIKHMYDKRPAREFDLILIYLPILLKDPDLIFRNKAEKRGEYCHVREFNGEIYFCSFEFVNEIHHVVTCFRIEPTYLNGYTLLWSRKDGEPSS